MRPGQLPLLLRGQLMNKKNRGQGLIEVVFAMGILILVLTGVVVLIINTVGMKTRVFDRKKATEVAELVMESLVEEKTGSPETFWANFDSSSGTEGDYSYTVTYRADCGAAPAATCVTAIVTVSWAAGSSDTVEVSRYFAKY